MGMSGKLLRPKTSGHPEALAWRDAVIANGGTVSASTMTAVTTFCRSIDSAGIRDRFFRLNLFCGTGLPACLVPLYRGPSQGGTQYGNTTDTNANFVSGDYVETGATGGLTGNGTSKSLLTGASIMNNATAANAHASVYGADLAAGSSTDRNPLGVLDAGLANSVILHMRSAGSNANRAYIADLTNFASGSPVSTAGHILWTATSATDMRLYVAASQTASVAANRGSSSLASASVGVFHANNNGVPVNYSAARLMGYSLGLGMTAAQAAAFYSAMQAFQTSLGRNQ